MRTVISLLVLLFGVQADSQQGNDTAVPEVRPTVSAELKDPMVLELTAVKIRLTFCEAKIEKLAAENVVQEAELRAVKNTLATGETEVMNLKKETAVLSADLRSVTERLTATEAEMKEIKVGKVAFSAALGNSGFIRAGNNDLNVVFSKVITNVGDAYSGTTGFFTAPFRGVYYFRFTVRDDLHDTNMFIKMLKNRDELMMQLYEHDTDSHASYLSSGLTLQLEVGDVVNMQIPAGSKIYDNGKNQSTFSGFLLFHL